MAFEFKIIIHLIFTLIISSVISSFIIKFIIKKENEKHLGQAIRDDIVHTHQKKSGTPTMGGVGIFLGAILGFILNFQFIQTKTILLLSLVFGFFLIGLVDDLIKVKFHNAKGLSALLRFSLEIALAVIFLWLLGYQEQTLWQINLFNNYFYVGGLFIFVAVMMIVGSANGVNMADGLDGLASGLLLLAFLPFLLLALKENEYSLAILITAFIGGNIGFLIYNAHPAKIFMGDAGSLTNGAFLAMISLLLNAEYLLIIAGGMFIVETLSVILQVCYFKTTHRRIFLMAPLHHHFEMAGKKEYQVVNMFYLIGFIMSFISLIIGGIL